LGAALPTLRYENGPDKGKTIELKEEVTYTVGSDMRCSIVVRDPGAAPIHFRLKGVKGTYHIRDEKTESGTLVNHEKTIQAALDLGDKIQIGSTVLAFTDSARGNAFIGKKIGGYRIVEQVGLGGMGRVFKAIQVSLNREVALKLLSTRLTRDPAFVKKFTEEARAAAALTHPNVIQVYDVGSEGNFHYYSMEFAQGGTVDEQLSAEEPIPVARAVEIIRDAAGGLAFAESLGIVHQDIKPQNLMIDKFNVTKIADMGLATSVEDAEAGGNEIVGTPHFISPERIRRTELDIRSDIYSLGCTFYMILTGRTPFTGETTREILLKQLKEEPTPIREIRSDVPETVCNVVERMMQKDPAERYPGVEALLEDLQAISGRSKGKGVLVATVVVVVALAAAAYFILTSQKDDISTAPVTPVTEIDPIEPDPALREEMETQQKRMAELEASNDYLSIPIDLDREMKLARLDAIVSRYAGTDTAARASEEAVAIREAIARDQTLAEEKERRLGSLRTAAETRIATCVREQRFYDAMVAADRVGADGVGAGALSANIPEVSALREEMATSVQKSIAAWFSRISEDAAAQAEGKEFTAAKETVRSALGALRPPSTVAEPKSFAFLDEKITALDTLETRIVTAHRTEQLALLNADLHALSSWGDPCKERDSVLGLEFSRSAEKPGLATSEYARYSDKLCAALTAGEDLVNRLKTCLAESKIADETVKHPVRGSNCTILGLTEKGDGLRLSVRGASIVNVPFAEFSRAGAFVDLVENRFPMNGADRLGLARAAMLVGAARASADLAPLTEAIAAYSDKEGWTDALRARAEAVRPPRVEFFTLLQRLAHKAASEDPSLGAARDALIEEAAREKAAMEIFASILVPFRTKDPGLHFQESVDTLRLFATEYTDTFFFRYTSVLVGGSLREGGHLVGFEL